MGGAQRLGDLDRVGPDPAGGAHNGHAAAGPDAPLLQRQQGGLRRERERGRLREGQLLGLEAHEALRDVDELRRPAAEHLVVGVHCITGTEPGDSIADSHHHPGQVE